MNTAFRSVIFEKDKSLLRAWFLVLLINIPGVTLLTQLGVVDPISSPFFWPALLIGGVLFGIGMVMAGGCASGTWYRAARGMLGSWGALTGFLIGSAIVFTGPLNPVLELLRVSPSSWEEEAVTLFTLSGAETPIIQWIVVAVICLPLLIFVLRAPKEKFILGWSWKFTGLAVGLTALAVWIVSGLQGRNFGLSFTQPGAALMDLLVSGDGRAIGLPTYILLGVPLGSFLAAKARGEARFTLSSPGAMVRQAGGGLIMGVGAAIAGGCNIGHGVTGLSVLSISSVLAVGAIMSGCWIATWVVIKSESRQAAAGSPKPAVS